MMISPQVFCAQSSFQFSQNSSLSKNVNQSIKLSDVVHFSVLNVDRENHSIQILLETKNNFKIYEDKLKFVLESQSSLPYQMDYKSKFPANDNLKADYNKDKYVFESGNEFTIFAKTNLKSQDKIKITVQACSYNVCLLPAKLSVDLNLEEFKVALPSQASVSNLKESDNDLDKLNSGLSSFLESAFRHGSIILFPALFLAGLLMNLTPCVYPMIPITLSVMTQFENIHATEEEKKRRRIIFPFIYVGAMVVVYSILGVFAGMTGNIFGAQLSSPIFLGFMASFMFTFGIAMLGFLNLTKIQNFGVKIPLAKNNPAIAVATMGAVSGLVSAPCTGPVLSMILVLIAKTKDPFSGFIYMMVFAIGFGAPYVLLGLFSHKIMKLPKFPRAIEFVKLFFAALMFSLGFYFLKSIFQTNEVVDFLYLKPNAIQVILFVLLTILFIILATRKNIIGKVCHFGAFISLFFLCMWLTLGVTNSFSQPPQIQNKILNENKINWMTNYDEAVLLGQKLHKPIIIDIWANWCSACLEMEETIWKNKNIIDILNREYINVKLDYSTSSPAVDKLLNKWQINGLPAIILYEKNNISSGSPSEIIQGIVQYPEFFTTLKTHSL